MAAGHPQYGGTNGVPALDFGQEGGALQLAGQAHATVRSHVDERVDVRIVDLPELHATYEQVMGTQGETLVLDVTLRALTAAVLDTIERNIEAYRHGLLRNADGANVTALERLKATQLTNSGNTRAWKAARLRDFQRIGPRRRGTGQWPVLQQARIVFQAMR